MIYVRWIVSIFLIVVWLSACISDIRLLILERRGKVIGATADMPFLIPFPWVFGTIGFLIAPFPYHFYTAVIPFLIDPINWLTLLDIRKIIYNWKH